MLSQNTPYSPTSPILQQLNQHPYVRRAFDPYKEATDAVMDMNETELTCDMTSHIVYL